MFFPNRSCFKKSLYKAFTCASSGQCTFLQKQTSKREIKCMSFNETINAICTLDVFSSKCVFFDILCIPEINPKQRFYNSSTVRS